ncbi:conserved hypothetical protein [Planktothrix paucivesiculata PCC 9631]|uniref:Uncharacterized protein n=2 Tax=Planktothrix TaxID=54304 RepID=A0A7Z9BLI8_9CYAN|nr:conserved hypothetical protein [Planktothrix paucivesiculata PCC 9631]
MTLMLFGIKIMYQRHAYQWTIHSAFEGADFWLIAKHNRDMLGKPIREYKKGCFGMLAPQNIHPNYGFYLCQYLYNEGFWRFYSQGLLELQHLRITDVRRVFQPDSYLLSPTGTLIVLSSSSVSSQRLATA